jgi:Phage stabilisation protein
MTRRVVQCVGPSYYLTDRKTAIQRAVNLYMMSVEGLGEDTQVVLESAPGLEMQTDFGADWEIVGLHNMEGLLCIVVSDTTATEYPVLYIYDMITEEWVPPPGMEWGWPSFGVGTVEQKEFDAQFQGPIVMAHGQDQLAIVDGTNLWVYRRSTRLLERVTDPDYNGSASVSHIDGYFVFIDPSTEQWYISAIDNASDFDALDYSSADSQPDRLVTSETLHRSLYLFGVRTTEVWANTGAADFPFERVLGASIEVGCVGVRAKTRAASSIVFIGQSSTGGPYVYQIQGYQVRRISTQAVEQALQKSTLISDATMWTYQDAGGEFIALNAPNLKTTWVWDASTEQWHERGELDENGDWEPLRVEACEHIKGRQYAAGGRYLYRMSREYDDLAGDPLVRERTWPHLVSPSLEPVRYAGLELRCTSGEESAGSDITLEISNDGGGVFGAPLSRSLGQTGARTQRIRWLGLGTCPAGGSRVFRLRCSDAVPLTIQGAAINVG